MRLELNDGAIVLLIAILASIALSWRDFERALQLRRMARDLEEEYVEIPSRISPSVFWGAWIIGAGLSLPITHFIFQNVPLTIVLGGLGATLISRYIHRMAVDARRKKLDEQTITLVRLLHQSLIAGETNFRALDLSVDGVDDPLKSEIKGMLAKVYTSRFIKALEDLENSTDSSYLRFVIRMYKNAEKESLSRSVLCARLERLYATLSSIRTLQQTIQAQAAQTKYGQYMIMVLIPVMLLISGTINPNIGRVLTGDPIGRLLLGMILSVEVFVFWLTNKLMSGVGFEL